MPFYTLFRCIAHKRIPGLSFHNVPRDKWDPAVVARIKELFRVYQAQREQMQRRTVLKDDRGVLWESDDGASVFFSFQAQPLPVPGKAIDAGSGESVSEMQADRVYIITMSYTDLCVTEDKGMK